ncbi:MAG TPA: OmpW family protein [Gammaproteobacteria bacterium]|nr:OmpW family protein [Gammaproteobacteria bacterium]
MKNKKLIMTTAVLTALLASSPLMAIEKGDTLINARILNVSPNVNNNDLKAPGGGSAGLGGVDVDDAYSLGVDITYMVTNNFGVELMLDTTSEHDIKGASGLPVKNVGDVTVLPPSVIALWHFMPGNNIRPYVGAGLNYTFFFSESTTNELDAGLGGKTSLSVDDAFGLVAQAGVDIDINEDWYVSLDAKYIDMDTDATVKVNGAKAATVNFDVNPWVFGVGVGTRF